MVDNLGDGRIFVMFGVGLMVVNANTNGGDPKAECLRI